MVSSQVLAQKQRQTASTTQLIRDQQHGKWRERWVQRQNEISHQVLNGGTAGFPGHSCILPASAMTGLCCSPSIFQANRGLCPKQKKKKKKSMLTETRNPLTGEQSQVFDFAVSPVEASPSLVLRGSVASLWKWHKRFLGLIPRSSESGLHSASVSRAPW